VTFKQWRHVSNGARLPSSAWDILQDWGAEREKLIEALPDPSKLEVLAAWLDAKYSDDIKPEVQDDLRKWANQARAVLTEVRRTGRNCTS